MTQTSVERHTATIVAEQSLDSLLDRPVVEKPKIPEGYRLLPPGEYRVRVNVDYMSYSGEKPLVVIDGDDSEIECEDVLVIGQCQFACSKRIAGCGGRPGSVRLSIPSDARVAVLE